MKSADFERFAVDHTDVVVSVCRACRKFVAAAPDPLRLALAEIWHGCTHCLKKPPARAVQSRARRVAHESRAKVIG